MLAMPVERFAIELEFCINTLNGGSVRWPRGRGGLGWTELHRFWRKEDGEI